MVVERGFLFLATQVDSLPATGFSFLDVPADRDAATAGQSSALGADDPPGTGWRGSN